MAEIIKLVTPVFRVSFPNLFEPNEDGKYGLSAVWTPADFTDLDKKRWKAIMGGLDAESKRVFKKAWKDLPANVKRGIRNGNEKEDMEGYGEGTRFASLSSKYRPGLVDLDKTPIGPEHGNDDLIYPGMYARATVNIFSYNNEGKGVALGLNNVQRVRDGERLDNRTDAGADFEDDIEVDDFGADTEDFLDD